MLLIREDDVFYAVYPAWLRVGVPWDEVTVEQPSDDSIDPAKWNAKAGGGVMRVSAACSRTLAGKLRIGFETGFSSIPGLLDIGSNAASLLRTKLQWVYPIPGAGRSHDEAREYRCLITPEHSRAAMEDVLWLLTLPSGAKKAPSVAQVGEFAAGFNLSVTTYRPSEALTDEVNSWCSANYTRHWFQILGGGNDLVWNYAVASYCGLSLAEKYGRLQAVHLVGAFAEPINMRRHWNPRQL